ncbi:MAG: hypothetical protein ACK2UK_01610 [Candidatus Promineifilaceae bacterium]
MAKESFSQQTMDAAKGLAPWRTSLPWWVVLIEGIVVGGVGLLTVLDPRGANVNLALLFTVGLVVAGASQFWALMRGGIPEKIDSLVSARAAIAVYAGLLILVLYFIEGALTRVAGFAVFGSAALVYGLLALVQVFRTDGNSRRQALVELLIFGLIGLVTLWGLWAGGENIVTAVNVIGWILLLGGLLLIGFAIWRWQKGDEADEMIESVTSSVGSAADSVTSLGHKTKAQAQDVAAQATAAVSGEKSEDES